MDFFTSFASSIARDLVCGAKNELCYPCCFNNFVKDLENEEEKIVATRNSVQDGVRQAKKQTKKTSEVVLKWLKDANTDTEQGKELLKQARTNKTCCFGHCPNWIWRYRLGKKIVEKKRTFESHIKQGISYAPINRLASLPGMRSFPSDKCLNFESRRFAYEELLKALECDDVSMIGLYGMGGCGKTTLAMEIGKRVEAEHVFDKVLFVCVSSTVEVRSIQNKIASALQYNFQESEERERAERLCMRLTQEERLLVILDDVWQKLNFEAIGIPSSKNHKGCKVLITSRSENVCNLMDCQRNIPLSILTDEEAWDLFQKYAHISEGTSDTLKQLAKQISDECKGLPVAIVPLASTLKGKSEEEWEVALDRLRRSIPVNIEGGLPNPYSCLQVSYDNLNSKEAKPLFLLCSVFPEDYEIPVEDLTKIAIGLGIVQEVLTYKRARKEVSTAKNVLVRSSLLSYADDRKHVKMHDIVRNVALWIAKSEKKVIKCALENDERDAHVECNLPPKYLWCERFSNELDGSNLEFLRIETDLEVSVEIFKGMGKLKVLLLINNHAHWERRNYLRVSFIALLADLRFLFLEGWELVDFSFVVDTMKLESLTVHDCSLDHALLDVVAKQLANLRLLCFSRCDMERNPLEVIGRLPHLEELYFIDNKFVWNHEAAVEFFKLFKVPQALQRYQIQLGNLLELGVSIEDFLNRQRTLFLEYFDASNVTVMNLTKKAEVVSMSNILGGANNIIPDVFQIEGGGMKELTVLMIQCSSGIMCLVDTSYPLSKVETLFSNLITLRIGYLEHLEALCSGLPTTGFLGKLEELYLDDCPKLTSLFTLALARNLSKLKILKIRKCDGLKHILIDDDREEISTKDRGLLFPNLKKLIVSWCEKLEYVIPATFAQGLLQLKCLYIWGNPELKYVFGQCKHRDQQADQSQNELKIKLPALKELILDDMPNIISVFPENCYAMWLSLHLFRLSRCPLFAMMSMNSNMVGPTVQKQCDHGNTKAINDIQPIENRELKGIFQLAGLSIDGEQDPLCLEELCLEGLPQLWHICNGNFQHLKKMKVSKCRKLKYIVSDCIAGGLPPLRDLEVSECEELKCIVSADYAGGLPQLKMLVITKCNQLDEIIEGEKHQSLMNLHLESNQLNDFPASTSIPSTALKIYNSGSYNLSSLTMVTLESCPMLGYLFTPSTAKTLTSLEELTIKDCDGLNYIVTYERIHTNNREEIVQDDDDFQCFIPLFPSLQRVTVSRCYSLQHIFPVSFARGRGLVKLYYIEIDETPELKYLFGPSSFEDGSSHQYQDKIQIDLPSLEILHLEGIQNLISICPESYYVTASSLCRVTLYSRNYSTVDSEALWNYGSTKEQGAIVMDSNQIINKTALLQAFQNVEEINVGESITECIVRPPAEVAANRKPGLLTYLKRLGLWYLPEPMYIWKGPVQSISLQYLEVLGLYECDNLKCIFPSCITRCLPQLKVLEIEWCDKLEQIFEDEENQEFSDLPMVSCQVDNYPKNASNASVKHQMAVGSQGFQ